MAKIDVKDIQDLVDQISSLEEKIKNAGEEGRKKAKNIKVNEACQAVPRAEDGKVDPATWDNKSEEEQTELQQCLVYVRDSLSAAAEDSGPRKPTHIMYNEFASNGVIIGWTAIGFVAICLLLYAIVSSWDKATGPNFINEVKSASTELDKLDKLNLEAGQIYDALNKAKAQAETGTEEAIRQAAGKEFDKQQDKYSKKSKEAEAADNSVKTEAVKAVQAIRKSKVTESVILKMVILLGALGGSLHFTGSFVKYIGNRQLKRSWLLYYLATPLTGAGLSSIVYLLLRVGLINPSGNASEGSGIANLNVIAIYSFAALTGLFSKTALEKLAEVFRTLFKTGEAPTKDPIGKGKPPGEPSPSA